MRSGVVVLRMFTDAYQANEAWRDVMAGTISPAEMQTREYGSRHVPLHAEHEDPVLPSARGCEWPHAKSSGTRPSPAVAATPDQPTQSQVHKKTLSGGKRPERGQFNATHRDDVALQSRKNNDADQLITPKRNPHADWWRKT
jgi:hypothetical protein